MNLVIDREREFIPASMGNGDLPEDEQIKVTIAMPTSSQYSSLVKLGGNNNLEFDPAVLVRRFVTKITKLIVNGVDINDGQKLCNALGCALLVQEIGYHIINICNEASADPTQSSLELG